LSRYSDAVAQLRSAAKPNYGAPAYSRWLNRPLGRRLAALAYTAGLTPNQVTGLSALASLGGVVLIAWPEPSVLLGVLITLRLLLGYALDSADGQLARLTGSSSPAGEWLDHMVDTAKPVLVHGAVLVSWLRFGDSLDWWWALVPLTFILIWMMAFFGWQLGELLKQRAGAPGQTPKGAPVLRSLLRAPSDWGVVCLVFLLWSTPAFWPGYTTLMIANAVITLAALPVWFRQVSNATPA
jgi:phosphatidylglycerophosphate synthase